MPATQYAYRQYTGNGSTTTFAVPFPYLLKAHVKVYTGYDLASGTYTTLLADGTGYTWTSATQIQATTAPASGIVLTVIRQTPSSTQLVQWQDGSNLIASDIDTADKQSLYVVQEQLDKTEAVAAQSQAAKASADTALASVNSALPYSSYGTVALIPVLPANDTRIEVLNSTGIEAFTPLSGLPSGFVGSASTKVRLIYSSTAASWSWVDYSVNDPLGLFVQQSSISGSTSSTSTTTVANSLAVKTTKDVADAALSRAGGTMTGPIVFAAAQTTGTTATAGIIQLTDSTSSTSTTTAATPNSVKTVADVATAALSRAGGTMTGPITLSASGTAAAPSLAVGSGTGLFSPAANNAAIATGGVEQWRITDSGAITFNLPAPAAVNATATLTVANLAGRIITSTTAAAVTMTLPTGAAMDAGFSALYVGMALEWSIINTGTVNAVTLGVPAGHTVVGSASVAANTAALFASRRTAAATWITYRIG